MGFLDRIKKVTQRSGQANNRDVVQRLQETNGGLEEARVQTAEQDKVKVEIREIHLDPLLEEEGIKKSAESQFDYYEDNFGYSPAALWYPEDHNIKPEYIEEVRAAGAAMQRGDMGPIAKELNERFGQDPNGEWARIPQVAVFNLWFHARTRGNAEMVTEEQLRALDTEGQSAVILTRNLDHWARSINPEKHADWLSQAIRRVLEEGEQNLAEGNLEDIIEDQLPALKLSPEEARILSAYKTNIELLERRNGFLQEVEKRQTEIETKARPWLERIEQEMERLKVENNYLEFRELERYAYAQNSQSWEDISRVNVYRSSYNDFDRTFLVDSAKNEIQKDLDESGESGEVRKLALKKLELTGRKIQGSFTGELRKSKENAQKHEIGLWVEGVKAFCDEVKSQGAQIKEHEDPVYAWRKVNEWINRHEDLAENPFYHSAELPQGEGDLLNTELDLSRKLLSDIRTDIPYVPGDRMSKEQAREWNEHIKLNFHKAGQYLIAGNSSSYYHWLYSKPVGENESATRLNAVSKSLDELSALDYGNYVSFLKDPRGVQGVSIREPFPGNPNYFSIKINLKEGSTYSGPLEGVVSSEQILRFASQESFPADIKFEDSVPELPVETLRKIYELRQEIRGYFNRFDGYYKELSQEGKDSREKILEEWSNGQAALKKKLAGLGQADAWSERALKVAGVELEIAGGVSKAPADIKTEGNRVASEVIASPEEKMELTAEIIEILDGHPDVQEYKSMQFEEWRQSFENPYKQLDPAEVRAAFENWWNTAGKYVEIPAIIEAGALDDWQEFSKQEKKINYIYV